MDRTFKGAAKRLDDIDLPKIGSRIGVGEDELHAFMDVEAAGSGFDKQGRPKMLFEPHIFYKNLSGEARKNAVAAGLAYAKWGAKPYPSDSYPRLKAAMDINETVALKSASWGLTQILAEYCKDVGYATPQAMVTAFMADEENHIAATVKMLTKWGIDDDLRAHRWATIARTWNGPGYAKNKYDTKMAAAFAKWQKRADVKWQPDKPASKPQKPATGLQTVEAPSPIVTPAVVQVAAPETVVIDKATIANAQKRLIELGYNPGGADGIMGPLTKGAIMSFRNDNGLIVKDELDDEVLLKLQTAKSRTMVPERANATPAQVASMVPEVKTNALAKVGAAIVAIPSAVVSVGVGSLDYLGVAKSYIQPLQEAAYDVPGTVWIGLIAAIAAGLFFWSRHGEQKGVQAYREGDRR